MDEFYAGNAITIWVAAIVFHVAMGLLAQAIAERKGHSRRWIWAGLLLSFFGVVWAVGLPDETLRCQVKLLGECRGCDGREPKACVEPVREDSADEPGIAAVLTAAVAAMEEREGKRFVMRSFRPEGASRTQWSRATRAKGHAPRQ